MAKYLTDDMPGIGGLIKQQAEDFQVEELPLYSPAGEGAHTFFEIEKSGLSTFEALRALSRELRVPWTGFGYAGLKDAQAVTRQVVSIEGVAPESMAGLELPGVRVLWAERHRNKLKIGHLRGNRFTVRIREVGPEALAPCRAILDVLVRRGVPNRYGPQRFGARGNSARLGRAVVRGDAQDFVETLLGRPHPVEDDGVRAARARFEAGQWQEALALLPGGMVDERQALQALIESRGDYRRAYAAVPKRLKVFFLSAYQSALFNKVLDARLESIDGLIEGDLAIKHPGHSIFRVLDTSAEQPRADRFEISPTGPVFGFKMMQATGSQGDLESSVLAAQGLQLDHFRVGTGLQARGARRSLRFQVHEPDIHYDLGLVLQFWLPPGSYATAVLAELMKAPGQPDLSDVMQLTEL